MQQRALVGAIDQSTTSTKFQIFDTQGNLIIKDQIEHQQITPFQGWLEHDPIEIAKNLNQVMTNVFDQMNKMNISVDQIKTIGITNQRETTVAWNKQTGIPYMNAIVWSDSRTINICEEFYQIYKNNKNQFKNITGLPINTYFSAFKIKWMLQNCLKLQQDVIDHPEDINIGTMDSWVLWNLLGQFKTDVSNASRTFLLNLQTLQWDKDLLKYIFLHEFSLKSLFDILPKWLPVVLPSGSEFGSIQQGPFIGITINSVLGDQMAACIGHGMFQPGTSKNTYGTGLFLLANIGEQLKIVDEGLLTSVLYQQNSDSKPIYVLEGAVECGGQTINWAKNQLKLFNDYKDLNEQVNSVQNSAGIYFVPAFSGLYTPYWDEKASGTIIGLTLFSTKQHILRAIFESLCFRTKDVVNLMEKAGGITFSRLTIDGGITQNSLLMQMQADILQKNLQKPQNIDSTTFGTAMFAALNKGIFKNTEEIQNLIKISDDFNFDCFKAQVSQIMYDEWLRAVQRSLNWKI